ncbi:MAG: hypothetical protein MZV63_50600 [Marinilabiliales bacterium]|nr:hypothetical protein [Marinilabiliales bacterium]
MRKLMALPHWPAPVSVVIRRDALHLVVVCLRDGGVGLMGAGIVATLILVINPALCAQGLFKIASPEKRRRAVGSVQVEDLLGNINVSLG